MAYFAPDSIGGQAYLAPDEPPSSASTVTGVTVTPATATISEGGTIDLDATVAGTFSPSQAVSWTTDLGTVTTSGVLTAPAGVATVTATSQQDGTKSGFATITIAAVTSSLTARTVTLTLGDTAGACANLTGIKVSFHDEPSPELTTVARYQSAAETADASGVLTFSFNSTLASGGIGLISVLMPDGRHYLQPQAVS
jgi:uncharacterized protein YjdB